MTNRIISQQVNSFKSDGNKLPDTLLPGLEFNPTASDLCQTELERTPGAVAVSQERQEAGCQIDSLPLPTKTNSKLTSLSTPLILTSHHTPNISLSKIVVGYSSLRTLLQPTHPYFKDKQAVIVGGQAYQHLESGVIYWYPKVKGLGTRSNPFRKYQLSRAHTGRVISELDAVKEFNKLDDFRLCDLTLTAPDDLSEWLSSKVNGKSIYWAAYKRFIGALVGFLGLSDGVDLAIRANLHTWSSDNPLKPHYHIHSLTLNYYLRSDGVFGKWFGSGNLKQYKRDKLVCYGYVPFSESELKDIEKLWTDCLRATCRRYGFKCRWFEDATHTCDCYVQFFNWDSKIAGIIEKLNYDNRSPIEDYARFSNLHPDCANPPAWLEGYANRPRVFGWWLRLKELAGDIKIDKKDKISPLTGKPFEIKLGNIYPFDFIEEGRVEVGHIGSFNIRGGSITFYSFSKDDYQWFITACNLTYLVDLGDGGE